MRVTRHVFPQGPFVRGLLILGLALLAATGVRAQDKPVPPPGAGTGTGTGTGASVPPSTTGTAGSTDDAPLPAPAPPGVGDLFPTHLPMLPLAPEGAREPTKPAAGATQPPDESTGTSEEDGADAGDDPETTTDTPAEPVPEPPPGQPLAELVGETPRPLVLVFWSSKCVVCKRYGEALSELVATLEERAAVVVVATGSDEAPEAVRAALATAGLAVKVFLDPEKETAERLGVRVTPSAFVIGVDNVLRYRGPIDDDRRARPRDSRALLLPAIEALIADREVESGDVPPFGSAVR